jgi:site-specific recombinase
VLTVDQMLPAFADADRRNRHARELLGLLAAFLAAPTLRTRNDALVRLVRWMTAADGQVPLPIRAEKPAPPDRWRRLGAVLGLLEEPEIGASVRAQVGALIGESDGVRLLSQSGLPNDRGLLSETADRLFRRILPEAPDDENLAVLVSRLFPSTAALNYLALMPPPLFARLGYGLGVGDPGAAVFSNLEVALRDAFVLVTARVQGLGLSQPIRERSRAQPLMQSPFLALARVGSLILAGDGSPGADRAGERSWRAAVAGCREELQMVQSHLEETGISLDVVFEMEIIEQGLRRLERLATVISAPPGPARVKGVFELLVVLVRARLSDRSLRALVYSNLHLLARKLVERAGRNGEHYIASTRRQYWEMLGSAAGAGFLTLGTVSLKVRITALHLAPFLEGVLAGTNYAVSFILIQLCGFTLATKQPSLTAATLAESVREGAGPERLGLLVTQAARMVRSQLCAAFGNVATVTLAAIGLDLIYRWRHGRSFLTEEKADAVIRSLHPLESGTIWYAAVTGIILWISSLAGGWIENFWVYRRLPQAISEHRLGNWLGRRFMHGLSGFLARNISGYGGGITLGIMLGMTPVLGTFFGLPLDVRHVTLSSGMLAVAMASLDFVTPRTVLPAVAGIAIIFLLNLSVSFFCALTVALRAKEVPIRDRWALLAAIIRRFARRPLEFILPLRD